MEFNHNRGSKKKISKKISNKTINRRAWSGEEDRKLVQYVQIHGERWSKMLIAEIGLDRGFQSCKTRWNSYLKPGIKKGNFTKEEDDLIISLHNLHGNKWCLIARQLQGRTDIDIRNHWNTNLAKMNLSTTTSTNATSEIPSSSSKGTFCDSDIRPSTPNNQPLQDLHYAPSTNPLVVSPPYIDPSDLFLSLKDFLTTSDFQCPFEFSSPPPPPITFNASLTASNRLPTENDRCIEH